MHDVILNATRPKSGEYVRVRRSEVGVQPVLEEFTTFWSKLTPRSRPRFLQRSDFDNLFSLQEL